MAFSNQPFFNIEDSNLNANTPIFAGYDSSMNDEMLPKKDEMLQILENVTLGNVAKDDVEDAFGVDIHIKATFDKFGKTTCNLEAL